MKETNLLTHSSLSRLSVEDSIDNNDFEVNCEIDNKIVDENLISDDVSKNENINSEIKINENNSNMK